MEIIKTEKDAVLYELMYVVPAIFSDDETAAIIKKIGSLLVENGGVVIKEEDLGKKRLAYKIGHHTAGRYVLVDFKMQPGALKNVEEKLRLSDEIIRHMIIKAQVKTDDDLAREKTAAERIEAKEKAKIMKEIKIEEEKQEEVKEEIKEEAKETKKVSLEDLDKKLDEILDDDVNL